MALTLRTGIEMAGGRIEILRRVVIAGLALGALFCAVAVPLRAEEVLRVFATTPDLGSLAREVGGDRVAVVTMVQGPEDPHFAPARPSWIKELSRADLYVQNGLELEIGYAPLLQRGARNAAVLPGGAGYLDASTAIVPIDVPSGTIDRSMGDVHPFGNPHYLLDPLNGLAVAAVLRDKLGALRPADASLFAEGYDAFHRRVAEGLVGAELAAKYEAEKLATLHELGKLEKFLDGTGEREKLGGWLGRMAPLRGTKVVDDHRLWPYFARRFGIEIVGDLEPKPGIPPTTSHLTALVERMRAQNVKAVIASPYYDPRHARFVAEATGAAVVPLSHQVGGRPQVSDYFGNIDYNVRTLAQALEDGR
jgi:ABC-type Zn uptake system ZnuABC Zn-binding protein ZnuA